MKGKIKEIVLAMQVQRKKGDNVTLRTYLQREYPEISVEKLYHDNGINPHTLTVEELMEDKENGAYLMVELIRDGVLRGMGISLREQLQRIKQKLAAVTTDSSQRWLTPEIFLDPVKVGQAEAAFFNDLIIQDVPVNTLSAPMPQLNLSEAKPKKIREGSKIELGTVSYGQKNVPIFEYGLGIEITYNALKYNRVNLVPLYFEDLGSRMAALKNDELTLVALNGDQADGSEDAAVIGVEDTADGIQWVDVVRVFNRMKRMGRMVTAVLAGEAEANQWELLPEVKDRQQGTPLLANRRSSVPQNLDVFVGGTMAADQYMFIAPAMAFLQLTAQSVLFEADKIISKRMEEAYVSEAVGYANFQRDARLVVDQSVTFASTPFPSWFNVQ